MNCSGHMEMAKPKLKQSIILSWKGNPMKNRFLLNIFTSVSILLSCSVPQKAPKNVIIIIGDGTGFNQLQAGIAFENDNKLILAGRTFEKFAELYPNSNKTCSAIDKANTIYKQSGIRENFDRVKEKVEKCYQKTGGGGP